MHMRHLLRARRERLLPSGTLRTRLASGAFWALGGAGGARALIMVTMILLARQLTSAGFGQLGLIQSTVGMFNILAGMGAGATSSRYVAELRERDPGKAVRIMTLASVAALASGGMIGLLLIVLAPVLSSNLLDAPTIALPLALGSAILFFGSISSAFTGALTGFEAFPQAAAIQIASGIGALLFAVMGGYWGGVSGAVLGLGLANAAGSAVGWYSLRRLARRSSNTPIRWRDVWDERGILVEFTLPAILSSLVVVPVTWSVNVMMVRNHGFEEMALFNAANQWRTALLFLPSAISPVILSLLANLKGTNQSRSYARLLGFSLGANVVITTIGFCVVGLTSRLIMGSYGPDYLQGRGVLILLALSAVPMAVNNVLGQFFASANKMWMGLLMNFLWGVAFLGLSASLVPDHGALGVAIAYVLSYVLHTIWQGLYALVSVRRARSQTLAAT